MQYRSIFFHETPSAFHPISQHSIFTTVCVQWGRLLLWNWHEERLISDIRNVGGTWDKHRIQFLEQVASELQEGALRITCTQTDWWVHTWVPVIDEEHALSSTWIHWEPRFLLPPHSKHGYREGASKKTQEMGVDVLLWHNIRGFALEASFGNLFLCHEDILYTPELGNIVPGIGRRWLQHTAKELGIPVMETNLSFHQNGWWLTSSLRCLQRLDVSLPLSTSCLELTKLVRDKKRMLPHS